MLLNLVRGIHYNWIYFGQITNETRLGSWQRLFGDIAETMSSVTCQMYKSICQVQKPNLEQIYAYIEAQEACQLFAAAALSICRRNSPEGVRIY